MKPSSTVRLLSIIGLTALLMMGPASAVDVRVMISAGFYGVYAELGPAFERASGHHLVTTRGPSMGDSPEAIPARLARGEAADVVILDGGAADELGRRDLVRADSKIELARSLIGMVVRAGAEKPDIGSVETLRSTLLAAKSIAYSDSGSGTYLATTLFPKLGIAEQIASRSRKVRGPPSGEPVAAVVARGEAEIGFQQVSELIHVAGVSFVGALPADVQPGFSFAGALTRNVQEPEAATALLRFLSSAEAAAVISKAGLMPLPNDCLRTGSLRAPLGPIPGLTRRAHALSLTRRPAAMSGFNQQREIPCVLRLSAQAASEADSVRRWPKPAPTSVLSRAAPIWPP
ncbi:MAG TPA: substrate-binding domain-containing protein [Bradyrhizobium sp.]|nr:substrate-binding domain-containing protein [Bradyrhizobium sp.]